MTVDSHGNNHSEVIDVLTEPSSYPLHSHVKGTSLLVVHFGSKKAVFLSLQKASSGSFVGTRRGDLAVPGGRGW